MRKSIKEILNLKLKWAQEAYEWYKEKLSKDITDYMSDAKDGVSVIAIGETQVGKTTLILDLIGIDTKSASIVESVLRGGREFGKSSTAVPLAYKMSINDEWFLNKAQYEENNLKNKLSEIRKKMEFGSKSHDVNYILIPKKYFKKDIDTEITILDLPGFNSLNRNEFTYSEELARKYVNIANAILLVIKAEQLSILENMDNLFPSAFNIDINATKYIIVTTFTFSLGTIKKFIHGFKDNNYDFDNTKKKLKNRMIEQIHTYNFDNSIIKEIIFPIEYGKSWENLKKEQDYFNIIKDINYSYKKDILETIKKKSDESYKYKSFIGLDITKKIEEKIEKILEDKKIKEEQKNEVEKEIQNIELGIKEPEGLINSYDNKLKNIEKEKNKIIGDLNNNLELYKSNKIRWDINKNRTFIENNIINFKNYGEEAFKKFKKNLDEELDNLDNIYIGNIVLKYEIKFQEINSFNKLSKKINKYYLNEYYSWFKTFETDVKLFKEAIENFNNKTIYIIKELTYSIKTKLEAKNKIYLENKKNSENNKQDDNIEKLKLEKELQKLNSNINEFEETKDYMSSSKKQKFFIDKYKNQYKTIFCDHIVNNNSTHERFAYLLLLMTMKLEKDKIFF